MELQFGRADMIKRMLIMLVAVGIVFAAVFGFQAFKQRMIEKAIAALQNPPQSVSTTVAHFEDWRSTLNAVGSVRAINGTDVSPQASGTVSALHFRSGTNVKKGDLLVELTADADIARLNALKATARLAQLTYERHSSLSTNAVTQQTLDSDQATLKNAEAQVAEQQALLDYKSVRAPFSGRLGIRRVDLGQYIAAGTPIVTLQQLDPIHVDFHLPQQSLANISVGQTVDVTTDAYPDASFDGKISSINSEVDTETRTVLVRATVGNASERLLPGMFVNVTIETGEPKRYVTLPRTAISYNSYGDIVYLVEKHEQGKAGEVDGVARQTFVKTGPIRGNEVALLDGVESGDTVVTAGQMKLRHGSPVKINNEVQLPDERNPKLTEE
ncbi:efflux RND transporter periplasmic adaptor subunit [Bradyrhizobium icense]